MHFTSIKNRFRMRYSHLAIVIILITGLFALVTNSISSVHGQDQLLSEDPNDPDVKKKDSVIFDGYPLYHNYIRPHMSLDGKTPAEMCGIEIQGDNKWKTLIQNASQ